LTIEWTPDLATGIELVDDQHRALYRSVAALHDAMKTNHRERVLDVFVYLQRYALEHFTTEEGEMARAGYGGLAGHREAHARFTTDLAAWRDRLDAGVTLSGVVELSGWLGQWLRNHVRGHDAEMARFLRARAA
jgi:hemerythrin